jgi:hypothetical protein
MAPGSKGRANGWQPEGDSFEHVTAATQASPKSNFG